LYVSTGGTGSIYIGTTGGPTGYSNNIVLNASGTGLNTTGPTGGFYVAPVGSYSGSTGPFTLLAYGADKQIVSVTGATGLNLSLSTPTITYDSWLLTNLIGAPPAVTLTIPNYTTNDIYITFAYPIQTICGYSSNPLPLLSGFNVNLYTGISPYTSTSGNTTSITTMSTNFIKSSNPNPILCIHLTNTSLTPGYYSSGIYGPEYVISVPSISTTGLTNSTTGQLWAWYNNNSTTNNMANILFSYLQSVAAAIITSLNATPGSTTNTYSITLTFTSPSSSGVTSPNLTYTITFTPSTNSIRYNTVYNTTPIILSPSPTSSALSTSIGPTTTPTGLFPDTTYSISVTSTNASGLTSTAATTTSSATIGYSPLSYFITSSTNVPTLSINLPTTYSAKSVINNSTIVSIISYNSITTTIVFNVQNCYANRGKAGNGSALNTSNNLLYGVNASLSGGSITSTQTSSPNISLGGWGQTNSANGTTNSNITLVAGTNNDSFTSSLSGYYQQCTFTTTIAASTTNFPNAPTSSNSYTLSFNGTYPASNTPNTTTYNFNITNTLIYWDGVLSTPSVGTPTINSLATSPTNTITQICGLYVYSGNLTLSVTTSAIKNVGYYYFNSTNLLTYSSSFGGNISPETTTANVTSGIASGLINNTTGLTITNTALVINSISTSYKTSLTITSTAYNISGTTGSSSASTATLLIYDPLSVNGLISSIPSITTSAVTGCRVWSGLTSSTLGNEMVGATTLNTISNSGVSISSTIYNNANSIISGNYLYEALYANGSYTNNSTYSISYNGYAGGNTLNYSTLNTSGLSITNYTGTATTYRYTTFAWQVNTSALSSGGNKNIQFILNGVTGSTSTNANGSLLIGSYQLPLFYRVEDTSNIFNFAAGTSTPWINGNLFNNSTQISSSNFSSTTTNYTGLLSNTAVSGSGTSTITFNVILGNSLSNNSPSSVYIYCRLAIPTSVSFSFQMITCNLN